MNNPAKTVSVTVDLAPDEALALAQFVKRSLFDTYREFAVAENLLKDLPPKVSTFDEKRPRRQPAYVDTEPRPGTVR
jgi:hypothetical protein